MFLRFPLKPFLGVFVWSEQVSKFGSGCLSETERAPQNPLWCGEGRGKQESSMACLLSLGFYVPPSAPPHTFFKETYPMKSVLGGLSNQPIHRTGHRVIHPNRTSSSLV
nr:uncharacterized protein LOC107411881 isoform X2 [Ziziphus jujuba var. spinosa]